MFLGFGGFWLVLQGGSPFRSAMASAEITRTGASLRRTGSRFWTSSGREVFSRSARDEDDEEALKWAVIQKLPTYNRLKKGLLKGSEGDFSEVDIQNLGSQEKKNLLERLVKTTVLKVHQDFLHNQTSFYDFLIMGFRVASIFFRVGIVLPEVEVRFEHLTVTGKVTYNGHGMEEFVPQRTTAYIGQHDNHIGEMTVGETLAFSARCQGVGFRYEMLAELARRENEANIKPDPDLDVFMKILGLDVCADTMVGNAMLRGISGGQKKRVTTGEMLVGPATALFMDEISTGLDSSTTHQIVNCLKQSVNILKGTAFISPTASTRDLRSF